MLIFLSVLSFCVLFFIGIVMLSLKIVHLVTSPGDIKSSEEISLGSYEEPNRRFIKEYKTGKQYLSKTK